eukprot:52391_1
MCGNYNIRLLDFNRIRLLDIEKKITYENQDEKYFGNIEIGILSKTQRNNYYNHSDGEDDEININKQGDILTLRTIIKDYKSIKTNLSRKQLIYECANKK